MLSKGLGVARLKKKYCVEKNFEFFSPITLPATHECGTKNIKPFGPANVLFNYIDIHI